MAEQPLEGELLARLREVLSVALFGYDDVLRGPRAVVGGCGAPGNCELGPLDARRRRNGSAASDAISLAVMPPEER